MAERLLTAEEVEKARVKGLTVTPQTMINTDTGRLFEYSQSTPNRPTTAIGNPPAQGEEVSIPGVIARNAPLGILPGLAGRVTGALAGAKTPGPPLVKGIGAIVGAGVGAGGMAAIQNKGLELLDKAGLGGVTDYLSSLEAGAKQHPWISTASSVLPSVVAGGGGLPEKITKAALAKMAALGTGTTAVELGRQAISGEELRPGQAALWGYGLAPFSRGIRPVRNVERALLGRTGLPAGAIEALAPSIPEAPVRAAASDTLRSDATGQQVNINEANLPIHKRSTFNLDFAMNADPATLRKLGDPAYNVLATLKEEGIPYGPAEVQKISTETPGNGEKKMLAIMRQALIPAQEGYAAPTEAMQAAARDKAIQEAAALKARGGEPPKPASQAAVDIEQNINQGTITPEQQTAAKSVQNDYNTGLKRYKDRLKMAVKIQDPEEQAAWLELLANEKQRLDTLRAKLPANLGRELLGGENRAVESGESIETLAKEAQVGETPKEELAENAGNVVQQPVEQKPAATVPEAPSAINAQMQALIAGNKPAVLIPNGTEMPKDIPKGFGAVNVPEGILIVKDTPGTKTGESAQMAKVGLERGTITMDQLLGMSGPKPAPGEPAVAVEAKTPQGTEAMTQVAKPEDIPVAAEAVGKVVPPGGSVEVTTPEKVVAERVGVKKIPAKTVIDPALERYRATRGATTAEPVSAPAAPTEDVPQVVPPTTAQTAVNPPAAAPVLAQTPEAPLKPATPKGTVKADPSTLKNGQNVFMVYDDGTYSVVFRKYDKLTGLVTVNQSGSLKKVPAYRIFISSETPITTAEVGKSTEASPVKRMKRTQKPPQSPLEEQGWIANEDGSYSKPAEGGSWNLRERGDRQGWILTKPDGTEARNDITIKEVLGIKPETKPTVAQQGQPVGTVIEYMGQKWTKTPQGDWVNNYGIHADKESHPEMLGKLEAKKATEPAKVEAGGIGGAINKAIEKNTEAGMILNPARLYFEKAKPALDELAQTFGEQGRRFGGLIKKAWIDRDRIANVIDMDATALSKGLSEKERKLIGEYLYDLRETGSSPIVLSPKLQSRADRAAEIVQVNIGSDKMRPDAPYVQRLQPDGSVISEPFRMTPNYWPNVKNAKVSQLEQSPTKADKAEWNAMREAVIKRHQAKTGSSREEAIAYWDRRQNPAIGPGAPNPEFRGNRLEEGLGLPKELAEMDFAKVLRTYGKRHADDMAWHRNIESDPEMGVALGLEDNGRGVKYPKISPVTGEETNLGGSGLVKAVLRDYIGGGANRSRAEESWTHLFTTMRVGTLSQIRDIISPLAHYGEVLHPTEYRHVIPAAIKSVVKGYRDAAVSEGAARVSRNMNLAAQMDLTDGISALADGINKYTYAEAASKTGRVMSYNLGKVVARERLANGDMSLFEKFGPEGWRDMLAKGQTEDVIKYTAAEFTKNFAGSYNAAQLPAALLTGSMHPIARAVFSLSRWSISRSNQFKKNAWDPAKKGNIRPLFMSILGGFLGAEAINSLIKIVTGRKPRELEWSEYFNLKDDTMYTVFSKMAQAANAGMLSDLAFGLLKAWKGEMPFGYDNLALQATGEITTQLMQFADGLGSGNASIEDLPHLLATILKDRVQVIKILAGTEDTGAREEAIARRVGYLPRKPLAARVLPNPFSESARYRNKDVSGLSRMFEQDLASGGSIRGPRTAVRGGGRINEQGKILDYYEFIKDTQGEAAAEAARRRDEKKDEENEDLYLKAADKAINKYYAR